MQVHHLITFLCQVLNDGLSGHLHNFIEGSLSVKLRHLLHSLCRETFIVGLATVITGLPTDNNLHRQTSAGIRHHNLRCPQIPNYPSGFVSTLGLISSHSATHEETEAAVMRQISHAHTYTRTRTSCHPSSIVIN